MGGCGAIGGRAAGLHAAPGRRATPGRGVDRRRLADRGAHDPLEPAPPHVRGTRPAARTRRARPHGRTAHLLGRGTARARLDAGRPDRGARPRRPVPRRPAAVRRPHAAGDVGALAPAPGPAAAGAAVLPRPGRGPGRDRLDGRADQRVRVLPARLHRGRLRQRVHHRRASALDHRPGGRLVGRAGRRRPGRPRPADGGEPHRADPLPRDRVDHRDPRPPAPVRPPQPRAGHPHPPGAGAAEDRCAPRRTRAPEQRGPAHRPGEPASVGCPARHGLCRGPPAGRRRRRPPPRHRPLQAGQRPARSCRW